MLRRSALSHSGREPGVVFRRCRSTFPLDSRTISVLILKTVASRLSIANTERFTMCSSERSPIRPGGLSSNDWPDGRVLAEPVRRCQTVYGLLLLASHLMVVGTLLLWSHETGPEFEA
jgi:hypothetical protein